MEKKKALTVEEELVKKIEELEASHAHPTKQMSNLINSSSSSDQFNNNSNNNNYPLLNHHHQQQQRSHSMSPRRRRRPPTAGVLNSGAASFCHSSLLRNETDQNSSGPAVVKFSDRQYLNILQSVGQAVHIFDLNGRIIYWRCET